MEESKKFNLADYLTGGIERVVKEILRATLKNPKESAYMLKYADSSKKAASIRKQYEENGEHIPLFLVASITSLCNLHCVGCYARSVNTCTDEEAKDQLTSDDWYKIFLEAKDLGISFIPLLGGEPLIRKDVIKIAGKIPEILFPIFTNGTLLDEEYIKLFDEYRNLIPIFSIEGKRTETDARRGTGVYDMLHNRMIKLNNNKLLFGASITVTTNNIDEVTSGEFIKKLEADGCKAIFYIEYVPTNEDDVDLALPEMQRDFLRDKIHELRYSNENMIFIGFPGDEKSSGGCLAAGRGFFHINSHGGAEPCPFSTYSDINVKDTSIREAMKSNLFSKLKAEDILLEDHIGGCVLYEKRAQVERIIKEK